MIFIKKLKNTPNAGILQSNIGRERHGCLGFSLVNPVCNQHIRNLNQHLFPVNQRVSILQSKIFL